MSSNFLYNWTEYKIDHLGEFLNSTRDQLSEVIHRLPQIFHRFKSILIITFTRLFIIACPILITFIFHFRIRAFIL